MTRILNTGKQFLNLIFLQPYMFLTSEVAVKKCIGNSKKEKERKKKTYGKDKGGLQSLICRSQNHSLNIPPKKEGLN